MDKMEGFHLPDFIIKLLILAGKNPDDYEFINLETYRMQNNDCWIDKLCKEIKED